MFVLRILLLICFVPALFAYDYQLCFLMDGPNSGKIEAARSKELQAAHMAHISNMWKLGALEAAGPVSSLDKVRGIFVFSAPKEKAEALAGEDPKVLAGDLKVDCSTWVGPAGIGKAYRAMYGKPGFQDKYGRMVGVLVNEVRMGEGLGPVKVAGALKGSPFGYFLLLDTDQLDAVRKKVPEATTFLWFHDSQVWKGVQ